MAISGVGIQTYSELTFIVVVCCFVVLMVKKFESIKKFNRLISDQLNFH